MAKEKREKWLRIENAPKRDTHPAFYRRRFVCKRIEQITRSDHGTYLVLCQRDTEKVKYVTLDCTTILDIVSDAEFPNRVSFATIDNVSNIDEIAKQMNCTNYNPNPERKLL